MRSLLKAVLVLALLVGGYGVASAQVCPGITTPPRPVGFQALTVSTAAVGFTIPARSEMAIMSQELADVRYRDDGTDPTASVGVFNGNGSGLIICGNSLPTVKFIRAAGTDALISAIFYGR